MTPFALRALSMSESELRQRAIQARTLVIGADDDILWAALDILERNIETVGNICGRGEQGANAYGYARVTLQVLAMALETKEREA